MATFEYSQFIEDIKLKGLTQDSAHGLTKEVIGATVDAFPGVMVRRDNINYAIGYVEALQLLAGVYNLDTIKEVAPNSQHVLFTINMAYGPRTTLQVPRIIEHLWQDPDSRRAILFIGKPEDGPTGDQPCTTTAQFFIRKLTDWGQPELFTLVTMRSWDIIKGLPYDLMMFSALAKSIAHCLGIQATGLRVNAGSAHIYMRDISRLGKKPYGEFSLDPDLPRNWDSLRTIAQNQVNRPNEWVPSKLGFKHSIPAMFIESPWLLELGTEDTAQEGNES